MSKLIKQYSKLPTTKIREVVNRERIAKRLNALEAIASLLSDLTPQQIKKFDKVVKRRAQKFAKKGFIRLATGGKVEVKIPPKFPGKPLSEYLKEIRA